MINRNMYLGSDFFDFSTHEDLQAGMAIEIANRLTNHLRMFNLVTDAAGNDLFSSLCDYLSTVNHNTLIEYTRIPHTTISTEEFEIIKNETPRFYGKGA